MIASPELWTPRRRRAPRIECAPPPPPVGFGHWPLGPDSTNSYPPPTSYPNLYQWLEPSFVNTTGSSVNFWIDQSGSLLDGGDHNADLSQTPNATTGSTINGAPAINYTADTTAYKTGAITPPGSRFAGGFTLFAVIQPSVTGLTYYAGYDQNANTSFYLGYDTTGTHYQFIYNLLGTGLSPPFGNCLGGTATVGVPALLTAIYDGTNGQLQVDGVDVGTTTAFTANTSGGSGTEIAFGGRSSSGHDGTATIPGLYGDGAIYTDVKSGAALLNLNRYFGSKYGISVP